MDDGVFKEPGRNLGSQAREGLGLAPGLGWNERTDGALEVCPVDRGRLVEDARGPWPLEGPYPDYGRVAGATAVIDEACLPRSFLKAFEDRYDPEAEENAAIRGDEPWDEPAFDFYGDNFYTLDDFELVLEDLAAGPGGGAPDCPEAARDAWGQALMLLRRVLEAARALEAAGEGSFGVLVVGP